MQAWPAVRGYSPKYDWFRILDQSVPKWLF
jgi:hypothetical protein